MKSDGICFGLQKDFKRPSDILDKWMKFISTGVNVYYWPQFQFYNQQKVDLSYNFKVSIWSELHN